MLAPIAVTLLALVHTDSPPVPIGPQPAPVAAPAAGSAPVVAPSSQRGGGTVTPPWNRRGPLLGVGFGAFGCGTEACQDYTVGAIGTGQVGYRLGWIAPVFGMGAGISRLDLPDELDVVRGTMRVFDLDAGLMAFPIPRGRFDPYIGARIGYARSREVATVDGADARAMVTYSRGGARLTAGFGIYVSPLVSVGPRFDMVLPFAGRACVLVTGADVEPLDDCVPLSDVAPSIRKDLPRWWSAMVSVQIVLRGRGRRW